MDINGRSAIITGGAQGLGYATAKKLVESGAKVTLLDLNKNVEDIARDIGGLGIACDISDAEQTKQAFDVAYKANGPATILVNAAAKVAFRPIISADGPMSLNFFNDVVRITLTGTFNTTRLFANQFPQNDGTDISPNGVIINVSSSAGADGGENQISYVAAKGGVNAMTLSLAREFGDIGIRVVCIQPGIVHTPIMDDIADQMNSYVATRQPLPKRLGTPEEFAMLAEHIVRNDYLNGAVIRFDGGMRVPYRAGHPAHDKGVG